VRGFTLIEILVTMVILGALATSVALALPDPVAEQQGQAARSLLAQAEAAALRADADATPWAWEVGHKGTRLLRRTGTQWIPADDPMGVLQPLPTGLAIGQLEIEGSNRAPGSRIVFTDTPPIFEIEVIGDRRQWRLSGRANGSIVLEERS
jgi:prepilin-type N-terminal cleavage/methylation domain-containing protein